MQHEMGGRAGMYWRLAGMTVLSYCAMYVAMYAMVDRTGNVFLNINHTLMVALMTGPMVLFELVLMRHMYPDRRRNLIVAVLALLMILGPWLAIRRQTFTGDLELLRAMIPHHAGALLMCGEAELRDPEVVALCESIIESQQREINQMKGALQRLEGRN